MKRFVLSFLFIMPFIVVPRPMSNFGGGAPLKGIKKRIKEIRKIKQRDVHDHFKQPIDKKAIDKDISERVIRRMRGDY